MSPTDWHARKDTRKNTHARQAQLRAVSIYAKRPALAMVVNRGLAEVRDGLHCTYEQDGHHIAMDMPSAIGGGDQAPTPGYYGRAAICSCLAIGIKMAATRDDLRLDLVRVAIEQDWDNRGVLDMDGASPVALDTRIVIEIESPEPADRIRGMVGRAVKSDPWFLAYRDAQTVRTEISLAGGDG